MYSTLGGAKKRAKDLKNLLQESGIIFPLAKCQHAIASAGGFRDWHHLSTAMASSSAGDIPFDFWGKVLEVLPEPCRFPIECSLGGDPDRERQGMPPSERWLRDVLPYLIALEVVLRTSVPLLQPGSGDGQRLRLAIVSTLLLNFGENCDITPKLIPDTLSVRLPAALARLVPKLASHPRFEATISELTLAGVLSADADETTVSAPPGLGYESEIMRRAREWRGHHQTQVEYIDMGPELSAALQRQSDIDRADAGPKVPYDELEYKGVVLESRWSVAAEFERMKNIVDVMPEDIRVRLISVWCDSKAEAIYVFKTKLGMNYECLPDHIQMCALRATGGYNGLMVTHGNKDWHFDPEWPGEEEWLLREYQPSISANEIELDGEIDFDEVPF